MRDPNRALFSVFDGHGREGDLCAQFARDLLVEKLGEHLKGKDKDKEKDIKHGIIRGFVELNEQMHANSAIDDTLSGTTAITVLFLHDTLYVANVGDSRAIVATRNRETGQLQAAPLSDDQTPYRKDERDRVKKAGARVLSMDQIAGMEPIHENWGDVKLGEDIDEGGDPPRIWSKYGEYPGTAFTRSLGDSIAEELGVFAVPEISVRPMGRDDVFIVIASDGVFEFLTNQHTVDIIKEYEDPLEACHAVVQAAYELWLQYEVRTDDITIICIYVDSTGEVASAAAPTPQPPAASLDAPTIEVPVAKDTHTGDEEQLRPPEATSPVAPFTPTRSTRPVRSPRARSAKLSEWEGMTRDADLKYDDLRVAKAPDELACILAAMRSNFLFRNLSEEKREAIAAIMTKVPAKQGDVIVKQGDEGDKFYVIESGSYEVRMAKAGAQDESSLGDVIHVYHASEKVHPSFGELALIESRKRAASVVALSDGALWALERSAFRLIFFGSLQSPILQSVRRVPALQALQVSHLEQIASFLEKSASEFKKGEVVAPAGKLGLYMVRHGMAELTDDRGTALRLLKAFDIVGEDTLTSLPPKADAPPPPPPKSPSLRSPSTSPSKRASTLTHSTGSLVALTSTVTVLHITTQDIDTILGRPLAEALQQANKSLEDRRLGSMSGLGSFPTSTSDMCRLGLVTEDPLGAVLLAGWNREEGVGAEPAEPTVFTLRSSSKTALLTTNKAGQAMRRTDVAKIVSHNVSDCAYLPVLLKTFIEPTSLHEVFPVQVVCPLSALLKGPQAVRDEASLRHICRCVVSILGSLHGAHLLFRGVNPELLFLDHKGDVLAMDFRYSKLGLERTFTLCGRKDYLAPEQVSHLGCTQMVDFWALGILLFEMLTGATPFHNADEVRTYKAISDFHNPTALKWPSNVPADLHSFIARLLSPDPEARLGAAKGVEELREHPFLKASQPTEKSPLAELAQSHKERVLQTRVKADVLWTNLTSSSFPGDPFVFKGF